MEFKTQWDLFKHYLRPYRAKLFLFSGFVCSVLLLEILIPKFLQIYIDFVDNPTLSPPGYFRVLQRLFPKNLNLLIVCGILYIILSILLQGFRIITMWISQRLAWDATNQLRYDLTQHCIDLDMTFHNQKKPGELIERIDGDVAALANFFSQFTVQILASVLLIIGVLVVLFNEHWIIGLSYTGFVIVAGIIVAALRNVAVPKWKLLRQAEAEITGFIEESISGKEEIRANGMVPNVMKQYYDKSRNMYRTNLKALVFGRILRVAIFNLTAVSIMLVFITGIPLFLDGIITYGILFAIFMYTSIIRNLVFRIVQQLQNFQETSACIHRIQELLQTSTKIHDKGSQNFPSPPISLKFDEVTFHYNPNEPVLNNLSFELQQNQKLGLIGQTGSGKTTIARLLFRLYEPQKGRITCNGINIQDIQLSELRQNIAYVTQNIELFRASIRDNITFFDKSVPDERIIQVIKHLRLQNWLEKMPKGLDTILNSGETGLSAGEAQLLALTRVFLKDPKIVVLDEASSRLDPATENLLTYAVNRLLEGRIAIIIAHRLSTLNEVDDILILTKGGILEYGNRRSLLDNTESVFNQYLTKGVQEVLQ